MKIQLTDEEFAEFNDIAKALGYTTTQLQNLQATVKVIETRRQDFWKSLSDKYGFEPRSPLTLNEKTKTLTDGKHEKETNTRGRQSK